MFVLNSSSLMSYIRRHLRTLIPFLNTHRLFNIIAALVEMKARARQVRSLPFIFRIEPCSLCNLRCPGCSSYQSEVQEKRLMDIDDYRTIIGKIRRVALRVSLYDMGEPLLHKNIYGMIRHASDNRISTLISTNFNLFREEHIDPLFNSRLTVLEPCLDGFTQASYQQYRRRGRVDVVKSGIKMVMEHKRRIGARWPFVDVQVVLFDHVRHEIDDIQVFLKKCNVDQITWREENLGFNSPETTVAGKPSGKDYCFWLYIGMMIRPDGSVYPCCGGGFGRFSYGNILRQDLSEIWNNKYYRFSRSLFADGPPIAYNEEMQRVPCLSCVQFARRRTMTTSATDEALPVH